MNVFAYMQVLQLAYAETRLHDCLIRFIFSFAVWHFTTAPLRKIILLMRLQFLHCVSSLFREENIPALSYVGSGRRRWLSGTISTSLVLDSTGFWVQISARTPILWNIFTGGDIT
jgi:hypothetical protein